MSQETDNTKKKNGRKTPLRELFSLYGVKKVIIFPIMALFFIVIIIVYHTLLLNYARSSILESGELSAESAAEEIELYLSSGNNTIKRAAYMVGKIMNEETDHEVAHKAILEYLTNETNMLDDTHILDSTGVYGSFHGEYLDGSGWDPGPDYDPSTRPWYTEAMEAGGNLVLVNPYLDDYSGSIIMTLAKALPNDSGVVAVDVTLGRMQEIISELTKTYPNTVNMLISGNGLVVAHTSPGEIGKDYFKESGTLGSSALQYLISNNIAASEAECGFDFEYNGRSYTAYSIPVSHDWYCISIADSDTIYKPIRMMVFLSVAVIILTLAIFTIIMLYSGRQESMQRHLQKLITSSADIYMSLCEFDLIENTVTEVKNVNPAISKAVESVNHNANEVFIQVMSALPDSPTRQMAIDFTDLSTINERMKDKNSAAIEYYSFGGAWVRARLIVSGRDKDGNVTHVLWMLENITKEKEERDSLVNMSERAVAASEAKSAFLSNMSHEIRTPINAVLGMNEMILRESNDEDILYYSNNIKSAGNSLLSLINDILDFSKIESGKMEIIPVDYDLSSMINDLVNLIQVRIDAKGLDLIVDIDPDIPKVLHGDEVRIKQIITNILTNAAKYTEKGSVKLSITFDRNAKVEESILLSVSVKDTGIGIRKEDIQKLFSEFERIDEKRNRNIEGTGLGMSIANNLLKMMGGTLHVESEYGKGSEFSFSIKQTVVKWEPIGDYKASYKASIDSKEKYSPKFTSTKGHILVVDDMAVNLVVFKGLLKNTGLIIDTAESGRKAIELAKTNRYDIMFIDHMMPDMDGIETLAAIKADDDCASKDSPSVCLTANAISGAKEFYMEAGFDNYLTKPIDSKLLEEMIYSYLPAELIDK